MGTIHTDMKPDRTIKEWADSEGINPDTARRTVSRKSGRTLGQYASISADEWRQWKPGQPDKKSGQMSRTYKNSKRVLQASPSVANEQPAGLTETKEVEREKEAPAKVSQEWEFWLINFLEMTLIIIGLARLYEWPGLVLAGMCCLFLFKAQRLARMPQHAAAVNNALRVVLAMCIASGLLHIVTFWNAIKINTSKIGYVDGEMEAVTDWWMMILKVASAVLPAIFVAYISFNAVNTTAKIHLKNN